MTLIQRTFDSTFWDDYYKHINNNPLFKETIDERVIGVVKNFEKMFGISYGEFNKHYVSLIESQPEKFI